MYEQWVEKEAQLESLKELENQLQEALELVAKAASKNEGKSEETKKKEEKRDDELLTNPTGKGIRNDAGGLGHFGAPRGKKAGKPLFHEGIDFSATVGQTIVAPFDGKIKHMLGVRTKYPMVVMYPLKLVSTFDRLEILYVEKPKDILKDVFHPIKAGNS